MARTLLETHIHPKLSRLTLDLRADSSFYQARTFIDGKQRQWSTRTPVLATAFKLAEDWYRKELRSSVQFGNQHPMERMTNDPTVMEVYKTYLSSVEKRKKPEAEKRWGPIQEFWRAKLVREINAQTFREFYGWRRKNDVGNHTLKKDVVLVRQILKRAIEDEVIPGMPPIPAVGKVDSNPRPWLTRDEWNHLLKVSRKRVAEVTPTMERGAGSTKKGNRKLQKQRQDLEDFMMFMVDSMMRVDELRELTVGQVKIVTEKDDTGYPEKHLLLDVHGKRGHRTTVVGPDAVNIFAARTSGLSAIDLVFPVGQRDVFRELLIAAKLRVDAFGNERNLKSLRATAISLRILAQSENGGTPNLLAIARAAGTSVNMINDFYARRLSAEMFGGQLAKGVAIQ